MTLRVAVLGCGDQGRHGHLAAYQQLIAAGEDAVLAAVCDRDAGRALAAAQEFGLTAWYTDLGELLAKEGVDAVSIATPPALHCEQTLAALEAGAHVLCEKPLALHVGEARAMVAAAARAGRVLTMGLQMRYAAGAHYLRGLFARGSDVGPGRLGQIYHTRVWCGHTLRLPAPTHFFTPELAGGGVLAATAVHLLDCVLWMLGNPPVASIAAATYAKGPRMAPPPAPWDTPERLAQYRVEDFAYGLLRFADGTTLSLETTWLMHPTARPNGVQFLADRGVAEYPPVRVRLDGGGAVEDVTPPEFQVPPERQGHFFLEVVRDFLRSARTGQCAVITGPQMIQVQEVLDALYTSARAGHEIRVPKAV